MATSAQDQPLEGVRVVELTDGVAGAYAGKLLAVLGADVVKVEPPDGDVVRRWGPFPGDDPGEEVAEQSALHLHLNADKRSVSADLATTEGRALAKELALSADIVLESFEPSEAVAMGFDAATLRANNPALVVTSITAFGHDGPYVEAGYRGSEIVQYAMGGPMHATGVAEREPLKLAGHVIAYQCGAMSATATMAGLLVAEQSGHGVHVDISNFETQAGSIDRRMVFLQQHLYNGRVMGRSPEGAKGLLPTGAYPAADGWVHLGTPPPYADRMLATIGNDELTELLSDPSWVTNPDVPDVVDGVLYAWLADHTTEEAMSAGQPNHWPVTAIRTPVEVVADAHFRDRDFFDEVDHPVAGPVLQPSAPIRLAGANPLRRPAPLLGQHTAEVQAELTASDRPPTKSGIEPTSKPRRLPLEGIRVLDLTMVWAGPYTTMLLGDLGADVIRVEDARLYNGTRGALPRPPKDQLDGLGWVNAYPDDEPGKHPWNRNAFFNIHARNKRSATVDLLKPEGKEAFLRLVEEADLVVENNSVGVMDKLGLGWDQLHARNDRLVVLRMPSLGLTGPRSSYVGFGANFEALCGLTSLRGYPDSDPSLTSPVYYMDTASGAAGAFAAMVALRRRDKTGVGEQVELAQGENMLNLIGEYLIDAARTGRVLPQPGNRHLTDAPQGCYPCTGEDRWMTLSVDSDTAWAGLREAMGSPRWAADERFATAAGRRHHHDELDRQLSAWTSTLDRWEATDRCQTHGVAAGPVLDEVDAVADPHLRERGFFKRNGSEEAGWHDYPSHVWHWDGPPMRHEGLCPFAGANDEVWRNVVGLDEAEMAAMREDGHLLDHFVDGDGNPI